MSKDITADLLKLLYVNDLTISAGMYQPVPSSDNEDTKPVYLNQDHSSAEEKDWVTNVGEYMCRLKGVIWFKDGSWATLESDGIGMQWQHYACPKMPKECLPNMAVRGDNVAFTAWDGRCHAY
jgi:hypothetical protein